MYGSKSKSFRISQNDIDAYLRTMNFWLRDIGQLSKSDEKIAVRVKKVKREADELLSRLRLAELAEGFEVEGELVKVSEFPPQSQAYQQTLEEH